MTNGISMRLLITDELEKYLSITKVGTYVIEVDEFGNTWLKLTSQDEPVEIIQICPHCEKKIKKIADVMNQ